MNNCNSFLRFGRLNMPWPVMKSDLIIRSMGEKIKNSRYQLKNQKTYIFSSWRVIQIEGRPGVDPQEGDRKNSIFFRSTLVDHQIEPLVRSVDFNSTSPLLGDTMVYPKRLQQYPIIYLQFKKLLFLYLLSQYFSNVCYNFLNRSFIQFDITLINQLEDNIQILGKYLVKEMILNPRLFKKIFKKYTDR